jgi:iron complex outermembrane recepter protein
MSRHLHYERVLWIGISLLTLTAPAVTANARPMVNSGPGNDTATVVGRGRVPVNGGSIKGRVTTNEGKAAASVTVTLKGENKSTLTDEEGNFALHHLNPGHYSLEITLVGYETLTQEVTVDAGATATVSFELKLSEKQLEDVVVSSQPNKFTRASSDYVAKLPLKDVENPQVYTTVSKELIQEQMSTDLNSMLQNVPGVTMLLQADGSGGDFASRGFVTDAYLRNGMTAYAESGIDPQNLERIEAIKGPSATMFGSSFTSYGGLFNRVTKRPFDAFKGEVSYTGGNDGLSRLTADINTPLTADKTALFRLNLAYQHTGSFMDAGFNDRLFIAPSFSYQVNDRLSLSVDAEITTEKGTVPFRFFPETGFSLTTPAQLKYNYNRSYTSNDILEYTPTTNVFGQINYKLSRGWKLQTNVSVTHTEDNGNFQWMSVLPGDTSAARYENPGSVAIDIFDAQQNILGDFQTGILHHRLVAGIDVTGYHNNNAYQFITFDTVQINGPDPELGRLTQNTLTSALNNVPSSHNINEQYDYALFASDVIDINDRLIAMLSLRADRFDSRGDQDLIADATSGKFTQNALSPKLGLVYQVVKDRVALFGNWMNGFTNENGEDHSHNPFKPEEAYQWEGGVKVNLLGDKLNGSISYYDIKVNDVLRTDPDFPQFEIQDGTQYSKGIEVQVAANPFPGFNIVAGYAHNDSKYGNVDLTLDGYRPVSAGPADVANLWMSYRLTQGKAKGLGLGFGGNYASANNIINESDGKFTLPSYTLLSATVFYDQRKYRVGLKLNNLTDQHYWVGWDTMIPQAPFNFSCMIALKF